MTFVQNFHVKDGELPVLPLSVYGAVVMAHNPESEEYSSPNQFFFYLYDKRNVSSMKFIIFTNIFSRNENNSMLAGWPWRAIL